jgi:hypothetical protein
LAFGCLSSGWWGGREADQAPNHEEIREAVHHEGELRAHAIAPVVVDRLATPPEDRDADPLAEVAGDVETAGIHDAVDLVLDVARDPAPLARQPDSSATSR